MGEWFIVSCRHLWRGTQPLSHRWLLLLLLLLPSTVAVARQLDLSCRDVRLPAPGERPAAPHAAGPGHRRWQLGLRAIVRVIAAASFLAAQLKGGVRRKDEPPIWLHDEDWHHAFDRDGGCPLLSLQGFAGPPLRRSPPPRLPLLLQALHLSGLPPLHNVEEEGQPQGNDTEQHDASNEHGAARRLLAPVAP